MRAVLSGFFLSLGGVLLYLFARGAFDGSAEVATGDPWESVLGRLWTLRPLSAAVLVGGVAAVTYGIGAITWERTIPRTERDPWGWSPVVQAAFVMNVVIGAAAIASLVMATRSGSAASTVGHLYILALLTTVVGAFLAFALVWLRKRRVAYAAAVTAHLVEVGSLVTLLLLGFGV